MAYRLKLTHSKQKGVCVVANEPISDGCFICEYKGEVIGDVEMQNRVKNQKLLGKEHNYVFTVKEHCGGESVLRPKGTVA